MRRLWMLEEQEAWKREAGFDRIEIIAETDAQRFRPGFDSEPFYSKLYNPRWHHTPEKHTLEMRVIVERVRMKNIISQPTPPPQCDSSPRRLPAVGTGFNEPRTPHAKSQLTEGEILFSRQASVDVFFHVCASPEQGTTSLLQADAGVDDDETTTSEHATAHEEFARPSKKRQQQRMTAWVATKPNSLMREGDGALHSFSDVLLARTSCFLVFLYFFFCANFPEAGTRGADNFHSRMGAIGMRKPDAWTAVPGQDRASSSRFASTKGKLCATLTTVRLMISTVVFRYSLHCFEIIGSLRTNQCLVEISSIRLKYGLWTSNSFEMRSALVDEQLVV